MHDIEIIDDDEQVVVEDRDPRASDLAEMEKELEKKELSEEFLAAGIFHGHYNRHDNTHYLLATVLNHKVLDEHEERRAAEDVYRKRVALGQALRNLKFGETYNPKGYNVDDPSQAAKIVSVVDDGGEAFNCLREIQRILREETDVRAAELLQQDVAEVRARMSEIEKLCSEFTRSAEFIEQHIYRSIFVLAKRYQGIGISLMDLFQEGAMGARRGSEKYDFTRGTKYLTYATWWIRQKILRAVTSQSRVVRWPTHFVEWLAKVNRAEQKLQKLGKNVTVPLLIEETGLEKEQVQFVLKERRKVISQETQRGESYSDARGTSDVFKDYEETDQDAGLRQIEIQERINVALVRASKTLPSQDIVAWRLRMQDGCSWDEAAERSGLSPYRVRQRVGRVTQLLAKDQELSAYVNGAPAPLKPEFPDLVEGEEEGDAEPLDPSLPTPTATPSSTLPITDGGAHVRSQHAAELELLEGSGVDESSVFAWMFGYGMIDGVKHNVKDIGNRMGIAPRDARRHLTVVKQFLKKAAR